MVWCCNIWWTLVCCCNIWWTFFSVMPHGNDNDTRRRKQEKIWQMNLHDPKSGLYIIFSSSEIFNRKLLINQVPKNILGKNNRYSAYIHFDVLVWWCFFLMWHKYVQMKAKWWGSVLLASIGQCAISKTQCYKHMGRHRYTTKRVRKWGTVIQSNVKHRGNVRATKSWVQHRESPHN